MEIQKLKLAAGRKGILLPNYSADIKELHQLISVYLHESPGLFTISFKDQDGDDCEILNQGTYEAAINEFFFKIILRLTKKALPLLESLPEKPRLVYFVRKAEIWPFFDIESEKIEWHKLPKGVNPERIRSLGGTGLRLILLLWWGYPISSDEVYLINPTTRTYK